MTPPGGGRSDPAFLLPPSTLNDAGADRSEARNPFQILVAEHELVRRRFREVEAAATGPARRKAVAGLVTSLRLHIRREERGLYPVCEILFGGPDGVAAVMRADHAILHEALANLRPGPRTDADILEVVRRLHGDLEAHFGKEERVLFPLMAAMLPGKESGELARRLGAVQARRG